MAASGFNSDIVDKGSWLYYTEEGQAPPPLGDGKTYSNMLGWQSPEGNFYGQERWVRDWHNAIIWIGDDYKIIETAGEANSFSLLPLPSQINPRTGQPYGPRQHMEIWVTPRPNWPPPDLVRHDGRSKDFWWWDTVSQSWKEVEWYFECDGDDEIPIPGLKVGAAHVVVYHDIKVMWNGYYWQRLQHDMLDLGDNDLLHLPEGFLDQTNEAIEGLVTGLSDITDPDTGSIVVGINTLREDMVDAFKDADVPLDENWAKNVAPAKVVYESPTAIGITSTIHGKVGGVWVNGQLIMDDEVGEDALTLYNTHPVLTWNEDTGTIGSTALLPSTEYTIYLANHVNATYNVGGRDARGKLFLSLTPNTNGYLGASGAGLNARAVGRLLTDDSSPPRFKREVDISWISRSTSYPETYREYCDYRLEYVDESTLRLQLTDTLYGQMTVAGQLLTFGENVTITTASPRVNWVDDALDYTVETISSNSLYYIYACNDADQWNFNDENPATGRPWRESDVGAEGEYESEKDLRKNIFLSSKAPEHGVMGGTWPGYYTRHIGYIRTDGNSYFKYASDLSAIRSLTLNPTHLGGLAEITFVHVSNSEFQVCKQRGTLGLVYVAGIPITTYDTASDFVHKVIVSDILKTYDEEDLEVPLSDDVALYTRPGLESYVYLANIRSCWGNLAGKVFLSSSPPEAGYLSTNYPGNNARWIATIRPTPSSWGTELVTNGTFETSSGWTWGTGWSFSGTNLQADHTSGTAVLSQSLSLSPGVSYKVTFIISALDSGDIVVKLGGEASQAYVDPGRYTLNLISGEGSLIEVIPSSNFVGSVDSISVLRAVSGDFSGDYLLEGTNFSGSGESEVVIDDGVLSLNKTWSSLRILQEIRQVVQMVNNATAFAQQKVSGIPLTLYYYSSSQVSLVPSINSAVTVVFPGPSFESREIPLGGIRMTVSGSPGSLYYVWLSKNSLIMDTGAEDATYPRLKTKGEEHVLVGYIGCSGTNAIAGDWNVFSLYGEPERIWTQDITSNSNAVLSIPGVVVPSAKSCSIDRTGSSGMSGSLQCTYGSGYTGYLSAWVRLGTYDIHGSYYVENEEEYFVVTPSNSDVGGACGGSVWGEGSGQPYVSMSATLDHTSYAGGSSYAGIITLSQSSYTTHNVSSHGGWWHVWTSHQWGTCNGQIIATRQAGDW